MSVEYSEWAYISEVGENQGLLSWGLPLRFEKGRNQPHGSFLSDCRSRIILMTSEDTKGKNQEIMCLMNPKPRTPQPDPFQKKELVIAILNDLGVSQCTCLFLVSLFFVSRC